jgi:uncharacterized protein (TIGR02118 family)
MSDSPFISIIGTACKAEDEDRFNRWYNEVHVPLLMKNRLLKKAVRYKATAADPVMPTYLAVYEYDSAKDFETYSNSPEFKAAIAEMEQSWGDNIKIVSRTQYNMLKRW